jgi:4-diphosphocytidyl-2-C-methyl-D-erythritol kinase
MIWLAPAKINLFLHIVSKRADGLHNLQTIFQLLDYCDKLKFDKRLDGKICRTSFSDILEEEDLIIKAAKLLKKYTKTDLGADISIDKKIPLGAGLGGGSSNAATTLIALNEIWQCGLDKKKLMELGRQLGADVPVFIFGYSAWAEGIGDKLTKIELPKNYFLIVFSGQGVSTKKIFLHPLLTIEEKHLKMTDFLEGIKDNKFNKSFTNDCLLAALDTQAELKEVINWLNLSEHRLEDAKMTGTGACIFIPFKEKEVAEKYLEKLPKKWTGFIAKAVDTVDSNKSL